MARGILALDLGTSTLKALLTDPKGHIQGFASASMDYRVPEDSSPWARELSPEELWERLCDVVHRCLREASLESGEVVAIGVTSQRQGTVFLDREGRELYLGPNLDLRGIFEGAALDEAHSDQIYQVTGHLPSLLFTPSKLCWFQAHRPDMYERIGSVVSLADWLAHRLTGIVAAEEGLAGEAGLLDITNRRRPEDLLQQMGLALDYFPPLASSGVPVGHLTQEAARLLGLAPGIPIVTAGPDTQCGLLGLGLVEEGVVGIVAGWSLTAQMITSQPVFDSRRRTWTGCFPERDRWVLEASTGDAGNMYLWLKETLFPAVHNAFGEMERQARDAPPGAEGVLAFLGPAPLDLSRAALRPGGFLFPVPLTFSAPGRGHLVRAALENMAFALKGALALLEEVSGGSVLRIGMGGGMVRTPLFPELVAHVLGREVWVASTPSLSALGAAAMAARATGCYPSLREASCTMGARCRKITPDAALSLEYRGLYQRWAENLKRIESRGFS